MTTDPAQNEKYETGASLSGDAFHVEVVRSARRRTTASLKFTPQGAFVLSVPADCPESFIRQFIETRREWMQKARARERALRTGLTV